MSQTKVIQRVKNEVPVDDGSYSEEEIKKIHGNLNKFIKFVESKEYKAFSARLRKKLELD